MHARLHQITHITNVYEHACECSARFLSTEDICNVYNVGVRACVLVFVIARVLAARSGHKCTRTHATCFCVVVFMSVLTCA